MAAKDTFANRRLLDEREMQAQNALQSMYLEGLKAGKKQGRREVVECLRSGELYGYVSKPSGVHLVSLEMLDWWQAQLKEWEL